LETDYQARIKNELSHYNSLYESEEAKKKLKYDTPLVWQEVEKSVSGKIMEKTGREGFVGYCAGFSERKMPLKILSIGAGPCGLELNHIMPKLPKGSSLTAFDLNEEVLKMAQSKASATGIKFNYLVQDANEMSLPDSEFDLITCYASLHHFIELERIAWDINKALKPDGEFVTVDICSRNGYLLWEENKRLVDSLFSTLPEQYHLNYYSKTTDSVFQDKDYSLNSFECINSEAIVPALEKHLAVKHYIPMTAISRRFFDHMYGYNFDLGRKFDKAFVEMVLALDDLCISEGKLKPETFFGAYTKKDALAKSEIRRYNMSSKTPSLFTKLSRAARNFLGRRERVPASKT
jgi:ubiquinone/menaquinone biosynthesis C-methylase UbiE